MHICGTRGRWFNGLLHDSTKLLPEPKLTWNHWRPSQYNSRENAQGMIAEINNQIYIFEEFFTPAWEQWVKSKRIYMIFIFDQVMLILTLMLRGCTLTHGPNYEQFSPRSAKSITILCCRYPNNNQSYCYQWPLLLTWFNFNPSMDK